MAEWIQQEIATGLAKLYSLSLEGSPASELLTTTAKVWAEAIEAKGSWHETDAQRFRDGFVMLIRHARRWPSVAQFMEAMPSRAESDALQLACRIRTPEERAANLRRLAELAAELPECMGT